MCDCFHLAFPNWHAPAAGAGRRLTGPEQDVEEDSVCAEPEILESERPRPQGSSPIEEFPIEKQAEDDISDLAHKSGSNKKSRKAGFGALFDKRTSDKMNEAEDMQSGESEMIVKTVKEACVEGLVVTGGGKEGIFIKEVKVDSPASKHLGVKEGDQILSATVYFDNVSYEDALKILEHAQPYKMEFCLRRQVEPTIPENAEIIHPKEKDQGSPTMRSQRKIKKQQERISWPKFPSFGKGPRVQFKRSHSTSEAEEHRKLEMSPPTSDTESPLKSPLKCADGKDKKKKHKVHLKVKMKGHRSKSVEEAQSNEKELVCDNQQVDDILEEKIPEGHEEKMIEISQVLDRSENKVSPKTVNDNAFQSVSVMELHEAHLISLGNTLKTTDISVALAEEGKIESSEMKVRFPQIKKPDVGTESHADNVLLSQTGVEISQLDNDISKEEIGKGSSEKQMESGNAELLMPNIDIDVGVTRTSVRVGNEKQRKEKSVFENESYGIRTRGPLADIATSKTHFVSTVNGLQFMSPKMSDEHAVDKDIPLVKSSKLPTQTNDFILADLAQRTESEFKLPKVDHFKFATHELIKKTEVEQIRTHLPKREDIEIPGMENKETKPSLKTPEIKVPKIEKMINITKERVIQDPQTDEEFNVEDVKVAVSKFPAFKLPEGDITGVLVQREIEMKSDKSTLTPRGSPHKISITSTDSGTIMPKTKVGEEMSQASHAADKNRGIKIPEVDLTYIDEQTSTPVIKIAYTPPQKTDYGRFGDLNFKLPKREDIEIPGMEAIKESNLLCTADLDQKCHEKKSKKSKITVEGSESAKPDTQSPDFSTELPKKYSSKIDTGEPKIHEKQKFKTPNIGEFENIDVQIQESKILEDNMDLPQKTETKFNTKFKIPSTTLPESGTKVPVEEVDISAVDVKVKVAGKKLPENKIKLSDEASLTYLDGTDANKDGLSDCGYGRAQDTETEGQGRKFKLPKFELSFPEVKAPRIICTSKKDDESSVSEEYGKVPVVHSPKAEPSTVKHEVSGDLPDTGTEITEVKIKRPGFSFPRFGISKSEHAPSAANVTSVDMSLSEGHTQMDNLNTNITISVKDGNQKDTTKFASPTKFKIPSIKFPNFGVKAKATMETSDVAVDIKGPDISLPHTEPILVDIKEPDVDKQKESVSTQFINTDIQSEAKGSNFKFGVSLPEVKGQQINISSNKAEIDISVPKAKVEMHPPDVEVQGVSAERKADLPEVDSKDLELKMKMPGFSFPKIELSKSEVKAPKGDVSLPNIEVSLPEGSTEIERPSTDLDLSMEYAEQKDPTKFKLPSVNFPKLRTKGPKASVEVSDVDANVKGPEICFPGAEMKLKVEPLSVDIKGPDAVKELEPFSVEMKDQDIQMKEQGSKFKLPNFGISLPEIKGPKIDIRSDKAKIDISVPKAKVEMHPPDVEVQVVTAEMKADLPEVDSKGLELKMKTPGLSFPKIELSRSEVKASEGDVSLPNVDVSLPEGSMEIDQPTTDVTIPDVEQKDQSMFGSPTKFKLPSINLPNFGIKGPKTSVELSDVDVEVKGPEINLPEAEMKLSAEPLSVDIKGLDADKELEPFSVEMKDQDIQMKEQGSKFKLPNFGISLPEIKGPKIDISSNKAEIDISVPKAKVEMHPPDVEVQGVTAEIKADLPEVDSKGLDLKMKMPGFSFPKIELSRSEVKAPEADVSLPNVDVSLPEGSMEIDQPTTDVTIPDVEKKGRSKFGSPTKFKLPSINFPKFGTKGPKASVDLPDVDVEVKGPEINHPEAEIKLSAEPLSIDIKGPDADKELKPLSVEMKDQDIQMKEQGSKFKLPKFGISLPEIKGPKIDISADKAEIDISVPKAKVEMHPPDVEVQGVTAEIKADLPEVDSKGLDLKMKTPGFSFPKIELSRSEVKAPEGDASLRNVDVSLPEGSMEIDQPTTDVIIPDVEKKGRSKFGSPTKFKLPSINFPKFGTKGPKASVDLPDVDVEVKGPEINLPEAEMKLSAEPLSVDIKGPDADKELEPFSVEIKNQDIQMKEQGSKFKLPNFGINLPEIKGPKIDISSNKAEIDISVPKAKVEMHPPDVEVQGVTAEIKADLPEVDSKGLDLKMKTPGFSFPKIELSRSEVKAPEGDASLRNVDVSLPEGSMEIDQPTTDVTIPDVEKKGRSMFGSPTKFKLPSINFPKFGTKGPKASVDLPDVDVEVKGPEINLPEAEMKLTVEPLSVDIKGPDADKELKSVSLEMKDQDIQMKEQGITFKLPKFGISLPEVKGPKIDISADKAEMDISVPKAKVEMHPPDVEEQGVTAEIKADLHEADSKGLELKMKTPGFSFPKIQLGRSEVKAPEGDVSLPKVDVSLPEGSMEIDQPTTDVTIPDVEQKDRSMFGSPTKFKLPSINLPNFGIKGPKTSVELSDVDVEVKGPEINLPEAEMKLSAEPLSVDIKGPDADKELEPFSVEMKDQDIQMKEQGSKFKLPNFGISLPEIKGPKIDISSNKAEIDISVPKAKVEMHPPDVEVQGVTAEIKADLPEVDSKGLDLKMKMPGFSFPKIELSRSEVKAPEGDASLPNVDVSLPEESMEIEQPTTDVTIPDVEKKGRSKFGSPTKFKLPSISFPKFGTKGPKASVDLPDVEVEVKGPEINLPEAEMKLTVEPLSLDIKGPDADKELKPVSLEMKDQDIQMKEQGSKFKLPKFGISLPEVKGPKIGISADKAEMDISVPKAKVEMHPPDVEVQGVTAEIKANLPESDSKGLDLKMKTPGFSFPKIELSRSEVKSPEGDVSLPNVDVSLPEGSMEIDQPTTDVTIPDVEKKGRSKFGSPTKFKLPSINFPKFGTKGPKASVDLPDVDVEVKGPEINLPEAEMKLSAEPLSVDIKGPDADKEFKPVSVEVKDQDIQMKEQGSKFKLPNFGISLPEIKGPKIDISSNKAEIDISVPKAKVEMHPPDVEVQGVTAEIKADLPEVDSKGLDLKMKTPGFSFPKIELSRSEVKAPEGDASLRNVDVSLPEGSMEIDQPTTDVTIPDVEKKGRSKFGSPTKFKLPSINFPKFGTKGPKASVDLPDVDVEVKGPEINLPEAEMKLTVEPLSVDIKGPDADKELKSVSLEMKDQDIQMKEQGITFKLPKFGISLPEVKGPKIDISADKAEMDISVPKAKVEMHPPDVEVQGVTAEIKADLPEADSKGLELKMKTPGFSFPKIELGRSEVKAPEGDVSLPKVDVSLPEGSMEIDQPTTDVTIPDVEKKGRSKFGSPTKFKLPSINLPKFGTKGPKASVDLPDVDVEVKGPEINLSEAEMKLSAEPLSVDIKGPDADKEFKPVSVEVKDQDIQIKEQGFKFKLPKFGISLPEVKGPKIDISADKAEMDISIPKAKVEMHPPDVEVQGVTAEIKANLPETDSKDLDLKMKMPGFSFPKIELSRSEVKAPEGDVSLPNVDVSLLEGSMEIDQPTTDVTIPDVEKKGRSKFGSPTKFKLPSINFPKFGTKGPKASVDLPDVDVEVKGPEINLPEGEMKLNVEPLSVDIKGPDADKELKPFSVEVKDQDIQMKEQGSKFKLPKFGISLPEVKGPKIDTSSDKAEIDISIPKSKIEMHPPDVEVQGVTAEIKADLPEVDSKVLELKMKTPGFSFPKIELSRSEVKAPEGNVSLPKVDVSLPEGSMEIDQPTTDVTIPDVEKKGRSKFGSPTKFKLPSINLPKFGTKGPKASVEVSDLDVDVKGPEINLPETQIKLPAESLSVGIKGPDADKELKPVSVEVKDQDIQMKEQGIKFKLPKFEFSLPEIKGPKLYGTSDKAEIDISVPKAQVEVHPPNVEVQGVTAEMIADLPEVDSKYTEVKMKTPVLSFPGIGFGKPEVKLPEDNASLPNVDVSLPEGSMEIDQPSLDVTISDVEQKGRSKFGSPTKFKLPSISFPKFGTKGPKASVEVSDVDVDVIKPARSLPHAEIKLSAEPLSVNIKGPELDKEIKSVSLEMKDQDIKTKEQGSKFKLPKFGISLSEVKEPKFDVTSDKADIDISVPKAQVEVYPPNVEVEGVTAEVKAHLPEVDGVKCIKSDSKTNNEVAKAELDSQEGKCGNEDTAVDNNALDVILEPTQKYTEGVKMSSKFILPTLGDVFSGFEVEFNVPTFDEIEETKKKFSDPLKHEHNIAVGGRLATESVSKHENGGTQEKSATDQNKDSGQKQTQPENSDWFRFPKLPSPTKDNEKITFQLQNKTEHSPQTDNESRKSFTRDTRDIDEDNVSPTLSLSSSDAFADVSSALTSERMGLSLTSPTKVKVKYSEPTANAEVTDIHGDIITSTARTEIISMAPHQPEKVNIPFSSETSSSSVDTLKQMSGHIVVSNVQSVSKTEHATILTKVDTQTLPPEKATDSMFSVEETIMRTGHTIVEKHVVKEIFGDDKEKIFVTQRIQVYEGDSTEPISDDTASSIQKLRDSVHTEKIRFFEEAESSQTILMTTETLLRHADSSTDENEGK
ncbi:hypothetical protein Q7C36_007924 [Tachysurus vachellii]|uniref:PDZ domain-containing protein n=1 Tax=Tachysurus vachellii TaxID=175792 RepID=A0AA88N6A7_TACVA|nr:hypothetical protein Q7C36_007924 [Tachysurus vachellii]